MPVTKACERCGRIFAVRPAKADQRFCCHACLMAARDASLTKTCENCGNQFTVTRQREHAQRFCSKACLSAHEAVHGRPAARAEETTFACKQCGGPFSYKPAYLTAYRKKFGKDPLYCSKPCSDLGRRADSDEKNKAVCKNCGKEFYRTRRPESGTIYREQQLCGKQCKNEWVSKVYREKHGLPQVTKRVKRGYVVLRFPAANGKPAHEKLEHRDVMEKVIGRPLHEEETIHHRDGDRQNNVPENLELRAGNHGPGQAVEDIMAWCVEMVRRYPTFASRVGLQVVDGSGEAHAQVTPPARSEPPAASG